MKHNQTEGGPAAKQQQQEDSNANSKNATKEKFHPNGKQVTEASIKRSKKQSSAFNSLSRTELGKIKGDRPKYEEDFSNDFNRYNVKYMDKKVKGQTRFDPPGVQARSAVPNALCKRGLTRLAEITLNIRSKSK